MFCFHRSDPDQAFNAEVVLGCKACMISRECLSLCVTYIPMLATVLYSTLMITARAVSAPLPLDQASWYFLWQDFFERAMDDDDKWYVRGLQRVGGHEN